MRFTYHEHACGDFELCPQIFGHYPLQKWSLIHLLLRVHWTLWLSLVLMNRIYWKWQWVTSKNRTWRHCSFLLPFSPGSLTWDKPAAMSWGHSDGLMEGIMWWETGLQATACEEQWPPDYILVNEFGSRFSSIGHAWGDWKTGLHLHCNVIQILNQNHLTKLLLFCCFFVCLA